MSSPRLCACGCGEPLSGRQRLYASNACKARVWKAKTGYRLTGTRERCQTPKVRPSGKQVSYRKAVNVLAAHLASEEFHWVEDPADWTAVVEDWLRDALPEKQR